MSQVSVVILNRKKKREEIDSIWCSGVSLIRVRRQACQSFLGREGRSDTEDLRWNGFGVPETMLDGIAAHVKLYKIAW